MSLADRVGSERGTGLIGSTAGVVVFLVFMLFAVQLTVNLYATSTVNAAGYDAARTVASRRVDHDDPSAVRAAQAEAERNLRQLLGQVGRRARLSWVVDADVVRLRVEAESPAILPQGLAEGTGLRAIDRTFVVRIEDVR